MVTLLVLDVSGEVCDVEAVSTAAFIVSVSPSTVSSSDAASCGATCWLGK